MRADADTGQNCSRVTEELPLPVWQRRFGLAAVVLCGFGLMTAGGLLFVQGLSLVQVMLFAGPSVLQAMLLACAIGFALWTAGSLLLLRLLVAWWLWSHET